MSRYPERGSGRPSFLDGLYYQRITQREAPENEEELRKRESEERRQRRRLEEQREEEEWQRKREERQREREHRRKEREDERKKCEEEWQINRERFYDFPKDQSSYHVHEEPLWNQAIEEQRESEMHWKQQQEMDQILKEQQNLEKSLWESGFYPKNQKDYLEEILNEDLHLFIEEDGSVAVNPGAIAISSHGKIINLACTAKAIILGTMIGFGCFIDSRHFHQLVGDFIFDVVSKKEWDNDNERTLFDSPEEVIILLQKVWKKICENIFQCVINVNIFVRARLEGMNLNHQPLRLHCDNMVPEQEIDVVIKWKGEHYYTLIKPEKLQVLGDRYVEKYKSLKRDKEGSVEEIRKSKDKTNSSTNLSSSLPSNFYGLSKDLSSSFLLRKSIEIQKVYFKSIYIVLSGREDHVHLTKHFDPQYKDQLDQILDLFSISRKHSMKITLDNEQCNEKGIIGVKVFVNLIVKNNPSISDVVKGIIS